MKLKCLCVCAATPEFMWLCEHAQVLNSCSNSQQYLCWLCTVKGCCFFLKMLHCNPVPVPRRSKSLSATLIFFQSRCLPISHLHFSNSKGLSQICSVLWKGNQKGKRSATTKYEGRFRRKYPASLLIGKLVNSPVKTWKINPHSEMYPDSHILLMYSRWWNIQSVALCLNPLLIVKIRMNSMTYLDLENGFNTQEFF